MKRTDWSADTSWDEVKARARGRRRWNVTQRFRAHARRVKMAKRLSQLQEEARAAGSLAWMPRGVIAQLANEFGVNRQTISSDIAAIDSWPASWPAPTSAPPPRKKLRDPRWKWAYARPRPTHLPRRMSVRMSEETYQWYSAQDDPSDEIRRALEEHRGQTKGYHTLDDCAFRVAQACPGEVQGRLVGTVVRLALPLIDVLKSLLLVRLKGEEG